LFILYFGMMSMITPPVAIGAFAAATLSGADPMRTGFSAMRFGWLAFIIPFMFVASPTLIMNGDILFIIIDFAGALAAAWLISVGIIGYYSQSLSIFERAAYCISGFGLIIPLNAFAGSNKANIVGLIVAVGLLAIEVRRRKSTPLAQLKSS